METKSMNPEKRLKEMASNVVEDKEDIHKYDKRLKSSLINTAENEDLSQEQKKFAVELYQYLQTRSSGNKRDFKYVNNLKIILENNSYHFRDLEEESDESQRKIRKLVSDIEQSAYYDRGEWAASTKADYFATVKRMLEHHNLPTNPDVSKLLPAGFSAYASEKDKDKTRPEDIPSPSDIKKLARVLQRSNREGVGLRNAALMMFLFDTGARIGEALQTTVGDVETKEHLVSVYVRGNKGSSDRWNDLPQASPVMKRWVEHGHPDPEDQDAALFPPLAGQYNGEAVSYNSVTNTFKKANDTADTDCKIRGEPNHIFRKAMETWYDNWDWLSSTGIDQRLGVKPNGKRKSTYNRPSDDDLNSRLRVNAGIQDESEKELEDPILPLTCEECGALNSGHRITCVECGKGPFQTNEEYVQGMDNVEKNLEREKLKAQFQKMQDLAKNLGYDIEL